MTSIKQILFWFLAACILIIVFGSQNMSYINTFYFVSLLLPVIVGTSYLFNSFLIPRFLLKKKYFKFWLYTLYAIILSLNLEMLIITLAFIILANFKYDQMIPASQNIFGLAIVMYFIVLIRAFTMVLKISTSKQDQILSLEEKQRSHQKGYLLVRADRKNVKILLDDIQFIESLSDYVKINLSNNPMVITKDKISKIEEKLSMPFLRIHRSFIVNIDKISSFSAESVEMDSNKLPISRTYKKRALSYLQRINL